MAIFATVLMPAATADATQEAAPQLIDVVDKDLTVGVGGFDSNPSAVLTDDGQFAEMDRQLTIWIRMASGSCSSDVEVRIVDPQGKTEMLTPFDGCPENPGLLIATFDSPSAGAGDWSVAFDYAEGRGGRGSGFSVRAVRLDAIEAATGDPDVVTGPDVDLGTNDAAITLAQDFDAQLVSAASTPAVAPTGQLEVGVGYVYQYRSVTEAGSSERDEFATGLGAGSVEDQGTVDVSVVRSDAFVEMTLLSRNEGTGDEVLSFDVVSGMTRSWQESAVNFASFNPGSADDRVPSTGVSVTDHGDMPTLVIERNAAGEVTTIVRSTDADPVGLEFVESVLNSFHFTVVTDESSFDTTETSRSYENRTISSSVHQLVGRDGVVIRRTEVVPTADLADGETRERNAELIIADSGVLAASREVDQVSIEAAPDTDAFNDNRGDAANEAKIAAVTDLRFQGSYAATAAFINDRIAFYNDGGTASDTLDPATAQTQRAVVRAIRDLELMDEALAAFAAAPEASATVWLLASAIEAHPNRAGEVADLVQSADTHDGALIAVSALVVAGRRVPQAQTALASAMLNPAVTIGRRLTAAVNAVSIADPSEGLVSAAASLAQDAEGSLNASSVLAWSALASRSPSKSDDATVYAYLSNAAATAPDADAASVAVAGLENLGDQASLQLAYETAKQFNVYSSVTETAVGQAATALAKVAECGHRSEVADSGYVPGIDWGCTLGTKRLRAALDIRMGVTGTQGGPNGGATFLAEGKIGIKLYERDADPDDGVEPAIRNEWEIARAVITSELDLTDGDNSDDVILNVPGTQNVQIGQVEREFRFQVRTILNDSDASSEDYWLVNRSAKVKCGLGASFDLSADEDGEPRLATNWDPWEFPIQAGPFVIELKLALRGSITFPTQVSVDVCNLGLFESAYYPSTLAEGAEPPTAVVWGTVAASITPTIKMDATISVSVEIIIVKVGIEAAGTLVGLELPIRGSLQILDANPANEAFQFGADADPILDQFAAWQSPDFLFQPCYSVAAHLYLLRMNFKAYGEFGFRVPPIPFITQGGWVTLYREDFDLGSWEWEPDVSSWPFMQNLLNGEPILESLCTAVAPMVPVVTPVISGPPGSFSPPRVNGRRIGFFYGGNSTPPNAALESSATQFCIDNGFPGFSGLTSATDDQSQVVFYNHASTSWVNSDSSGGPAPEQAHTIATLQCDISTQSTPGSGEIGLCLSSDPLDWALIYSGPYGGYITTDSEGGEFTPFLSAADSGAWSPSGSSERVLQLAWYRVCVNTDGTVIRSTGNVPLDKEVIFQYLTPWISGTSAFADCVSYQAELNLYALVDCDRFDPESFPDLSVNVNIDDGQGSSMLTTANSVPGPTIISGPATIQFDVANTGQFDVTDISVSTSGATPASCEIETLAVNNSLAVGDSATCTAVMSTSIDSDGTLVEVAGTQSRNLTVTGTYSKDGETLEASFTQSFFFTVEPSDEPSFEVRVSLIGAGGTYDVVSGSTPIEVPPGEYNLFPSITNTGQTALTVDSVTSSFATWADPSGCDVGTLASGLTFSCDPQTVTVQADQDYSGTVEVSAMGLSESTDVSFTGAASPAGPPLSASDLEIAAYMTLSGDATQYDPSSQATAPVMNPLLPATADSNVLTFTVTNTTANRMVHISDGDIDFSRGDNIQSIFQCYGLQVQLGDSSTDLGWEVDPNDTLECVAQIVAGQPGSESPSTFTVVARASDEPTTATYTSQNWMKTGIAQLAFDSVTEQTETNALAATLVNVSTYEGSLGTITVEMTNSTGSSVGSLACGSTELATDGSTTCNLQNVSSFAAGTYTLTASAAGAPDATTTWTNTDTPINTDVDFELTLRVDADRVGDADIVEAGDVVEIAIINRNPDQPLTLDAFVATREYWEWDGAYDCEQAAPASGLATAVIPAGGTLTCEVMITPAQLLIADVARPYGTYDVLVSSADVTETASASWGQRSVINIGESGSGDGAMHIQGRGPMPNAISVLGRTSDNLDTIVEWIDDEFIEGVDGEWTAVFNVDWNPLGLVLEDFELNAEFDVETGGLVLTPITIVYPGDDDTIVFPNVVIIQPSDIVEVREVLVPTDPAMSAYPYETEVELAIEVTQGQIVVAPSTDELPSGIRHRVTATGNTVRVSGSAVDENEIFRQAEFLFSEVREPVVFSETLNFSDAIEFQFAQDVDASATVTLGGLWSRAFQFELDIDQWWDPVVETYETVSSVGISVEADLAVDLGLQYNSDLGNALLNNKFEFIPELESPIIRLLPTAIGPIPFTFNRGVEFEWAFEFDGNVTAHASLSRSVESRTSWVDGNRFFNLPEVSTTASDSTFEFEAALTKATLEFYVDAEFDVGVWPMNKFAELTTAVKVGVVAEAVSPAGELSEVVFSLAGSVNVGLELLEGFPVDRLGPLQGWTAEFLDQDDVIFSLPMTPVELFRWTRPGYVDPPSGQWTVQFEAAENANNTAADVLDGNPAYTVAHVRLDALPTTPGQAGSIDEFWITPEGASTTFDGNHTAGSELRSVEMTIWGFPGLGGCLDSDQATTTVQVTDPGGGISTHEPFVECGEFGTLVEGVIYLDDILLSGTVGEWEVSFTHNAVVLPFIDGVALEFLTVGADAIVGNAGDDFDVYFTTYENNDRATVGALQAGIGATDTHLSLWVRVVNNWVCEEQVRVRITDPRGNESLTKFPYTTCVDYWEGSSSNVVQVVMDLPDIRWDE